ncbi:MAG: MFS transporter [Burkholderiaceae bacterium]
MIPAPLQPLRDFVRFWWARLANTCASQMLMVAVGWQMYDLTGSAWDLGLIGLLQFLPALALVLVTGDVVDRHHRARVAAICVGVQGTVALVLALAPWAGGAQRGLLLALAVVLGAAKAFQMPAQQALVPLLVPPGLLPRALAFSAAGMQLAIIAGPAIGGLIYVGGASAVYITCMVLFAAATALLLRVHHADPPARERATWQTLLAGVTYVRSNPVVLGAISLDLFAVLLGGATALLPIFAKDLLGVGPWGLGLLRGAPAVGALLMSLALSRWPMTRRAGPRMLWAVVVYGLATAVFGVSSSLVVSMVALAVTGAADMVSIVVRQSLVQLETPDAMRGRVSAVNSVFIGASNQLGEFESGATAALFGPVASVLLGGAGSVVIALLWWRLFPALAKRDRFAQSA